MKNFFWTSSPTRAAYIWHGKQTLSLAYPVMLSQLGHIMVNVADSMFVGQLGPAALGAVSIATVIFSVFLVIGLGFSFGLTPLVAAAHGRGRLSEAVYYFRHSFMLNSIIGLFLGLMGFLAGPLLSLLGQRAEVVVLAEPFLRFSLFCLPFIMIFQSFKQCIEGLSDTRTSMIISIFANLLNLLLNYVLVFGEWGFPALGILGSGIASFVARIVMVVSLVVWLSFRPWFRPFFWHLRLGRYSGAAFGRLIGLGGPVSLQMLLEVGAFGGASVLAGWLGIKALAAHQIALNIASVVYMAASGLGAAATVRVSNMRGQGRLPDMRRAGYSAMLLAIILMSCSSIIFIVFRNYFPLLYNKDMEVVGLAASLLIIAGFFQISDGVQVTIMGALRGLTDVRMPTLINFLAYWIIGLPVGWVLSLYMGVAGIWYGLCIGLTVSSVLLFLRFKKLSVVLENNLK